MKNYYDYELVNKVVNPQFEGSYYSPIISRGIESLAQLLYLYTSIRGMNSVLKEAIEKKVPQIKGSWDLGPGVQALECNYGHISFNVCKECHEIPEFVLTGVTPYGSFGTKFLDVHRSLSQKIHHEIHDYVRTLKYAPWWVILSGINCSGYGLRSINLQNIEPPTEIDSSSPFHDDGNIIWEFPHNGGTLKEEAEQADEFIKKLKDLHHAASLIFYYSENSAVPIDPTELRNGDKNPRWGYGHILAQSIFESRYDGWKRDLEEVLRKEYRRSLLPKMRRNLKRLSATDSRITKDEVQFIISFCTETLRNIGKSKC